MLLSIGSRTPCGTVGTFNSF